MVSTNQSARLVKHIIRSYARLSENQRVRSILKDNLPVIFKDKNFQNNLDETSRRWIQSIFKHLSMSTNSKQLVEGGEINISKDQGFLLNNQNQQTSISNNLK
jgi:thioredoxin reductase